MEYTTLGSTGMTVSRICVGCYSFGDGYDWQLDEAESSELIDRAIDLGINFFDTANAYSSGKSEEILGSALSGYDSDRTVVATKVHHDMDSSNPNASGLSRKAIEQELEHSLDRLGMETIDLYQIHNWDDQTPIKETLETLDDVVRRGQARYIGGSSMWAYQFAKSLYTSELHDLEQFVSMTNHYNLVYREEEREMNPLCAEMGVGLLPWCPLGRGFLTRPHEEYDTTTRSSAVLGRQPERIRIYRENGGEEINERVQELAENEGVSMAQLALSWLLHKDTVDAPIVGTTSIKHLEEAVEALEIDLSESDLEYLEEPYEPGEVTGF